MPDLDLGGNAEKEQLKENLEILLAQCSHQYTKGFSMVTPVPDRISRHWSAQLQLFDTSSAQRMTQAFLTAVEQARTPEESSEMVMEEAVAQQNRLSNIRQYSEAQYQAWAGLINRPDYPYYLFISEQSDTTCDTCLHHHGKLYGAESLERILPPLHPNCRCILVALDSQMVVQYQYKPETFLKIVEQTALSVSHGAGGVFYLDHSALTNGVNQYTLVSLSQDVPLQIVHSVDGISQAAQGFDGFLSSAKQGLAEFLADAGAAMTGIGDHIGNQFMAGVALWEENFLLSIAYMADALTLTIASSLWDGFVSRFHEMTQAPTAYSIFNFFTLGIVEMLDDTFTPDDPWSFEHWMNILGTATLIVGAVKFGMKATIGADDLIDDVGRASIDDVVDDVGRASIDDSLLDDVIAETDQGVLDDIVDDVLGETTSAVSFPVVGDDLLGMTTSQVDDVLERVATEYGEIISTESANVRNTAILLENPSYKPSYIPDTTTYQIALSQDTTFVRVYGGGSFQISNWVVRADDIAGLTAEQIKSKLSLPHAPEYICDVAVPAGTVLEVSGANGIMGGLGGGVQFVLQGDYLREWFTNARLLN